MGGLLPGRTDRTDAVFYRLRREWVKERHILGLVVRERGIIAGGHAPARPRPCLTCQSPPATFELRGKSIFYRLLCASRSLRLLLLFVTAVPGVDSMSKKYLVWILLVAAGAAAVFFGYQYWRSLQSSLPEGIAFGNGRVEAKLVDVAAKEALRVKEILVDEGDLVKPNQVLVRLDTATLEAELAEAEANVASTQEREAVTNSGIVKRKSEVDLAVIELERARKLLASAAASQQEFDRRNTYLQVSKAARRGRRSQVADRAAGGQGRRGQRGDDPDPHRRRDAQVPRPWKGALSLGGSWRGPGSRRKSTDVGEPGRRLHGDIPSLGTGRPASRLAPRRGLPWTMLPAARPPDM